MTQIQTINRYKCRRCDSIYASYDKAGSCCFIAEKQEIYPCGVCNEYHDSEDEAMECCSSPIEIYSSHYLKSKLHTLWHEDDDDDDEVTESNIFTLTPEFIIKLDENKFKIMLPFSIVTNTIFDLLSTDLWDIWDLQSRNNYWLIEASENSITINLNDYNAATVCTNLLKIFKDNLHLEIDTKFNKTRQALSNLLDRNNVDHPDKDYILEHTSDIYFDFQNGEIWIMGRSFYAKSINDGMTDKKGKLFVKIDHKHDDIYCANLYDSVQAWSERKVLQDQKDQMQSQQHGVVS